MVEYIHNSRCLGLRGAGCGTNSLPRYQVDSYIDRREKYVFGQRNGNLLGQHMKEARTRKKNNKE